ncbi:Acetyltransferase (GNAT) domain-containing protein [Sporobacter termitidis DSM 10068]|uniref:Acetyltransferase (GNAT) domain-containing protein n=1 Tax=Sporobacter termitidis DSM 10068 TaxID=1123282 RepID=A0A1M5Y1Z3_9FIRM|nr:GNAT family N-acetyltransferase [Sporobacter termitidis]SHI06090.1 Acetyltransferase (GNAT) domain-containing protein [Sporobacter termitidis DSM 10068]
MEIMPITENKKQFLDLLLLADEQESMIDQYLGRGTLFALYDGGLKSVCVVTDEGRGVCELKNLATYPQFQGMGYGTKLIEFIVNYYRNQFNMMLVGTGDSPITVPFYERRGFVFSHRLVNFIPEHYDHPIYENGVLLKDVIYLKMALSEKA